MTTTVHKQALLPGVHYYPMPLGTQLLHVAMQNNIPCIWYRCDPQYSIEQRQLLLVGTGFDIPHGDYNFIGTMLTTDTRFVFHVFEVM